LSLSDDFDSIGATSQKAAPATAPAVAPIAATPAAPVAGAQAAPSLSAQFDATPISAAKPNAPKPAATSPATPAKGLHEETPLDIAGAAVEPLLSLGTAAIAQPVGWAARLASAALGNDYAGAKQAGDNITNALTYQPQTQGGQEAQNGLAQMAKGISSAVMASPAGPVISGIGDAYNKQFVQGAPNAFMATVNNIVPAATANIVAGPLVGKASALVKGGNKLAALSAPEAAIAANPLAAAARVEPAFAPEVDPATAAPAAGEAAPTAAPSKPNYVPNGDGTFTQTEPKQPPPGAAQPTPDAAQPRGAGTAAPDASTLRGVGAAEANNNPYSGLTGEEAARGGSSAFPQVKVAKNAGDVPEAEQAVRAQIANEILGPENDAVRPGVVTGNEDTLRSEYTHAKSSDNTPAQLVLRNQIANEQQALSDYAQQRVEATGANPNLTNNEQRGQVINDAFHGEGGLSDYFKQAKQQIYDQARAQSGDNPIQSSHVDALLKDPQFLAEAERNGHTGVVSGAQKLIDLARSTGFKDPVTGQVTPPGSVAAWDAVRKSNNAGWSPDNSRTIGAINRAIDQDVSAAAGSDAYKLGDSIHRAQKTIMDVPAIGKIFGGADANGIKDGVSLEKLPAKLNNMPLDQWRHVYNTLDDLSRGQVRGAPEGMPPVPQELQQLAGTARNEISGSLAREVYEQGAGKAGVWNQNSANKTLNSVVGQKILETFPPDEVQRFHALNYGGQIMPGVHSYEGAALQKQRLSNPSFVERHATKAGSAIGGAIGGAVSGGAGAGIGAGAGSWAGNKLAARSEAVRRTGEANKLLQMMRANSKLGR
jgi:hypothetical protein